ncbi:hypothetical protein K502DRAFT_353584 [Neoconidiobolus thromboides FSU 785]|nr:hypothetical protein K502DRAFT_353584 [Neoconidiobolus thromboides FSU 785]
MEVLVEDDVKFSLLLGVIVFIIGVASIILNGLVIYITNLKNNVKSKIDAQLIFLIAVFDSISSLFVVISQMIEWGSTSPLSFRTSAWCHASSIIYDPSTIIALCLTSQLSIMRYLIIVKSYKISTVSSTIVSAIIISAILIIFTVTTVYGNSKLMPSALYCVPINKVIGSIGDLLFGVFCLITVVPNVFIIPICYTSISWYYQKITNNLNAEHIKVRRSFFQKYSSFIGLVIFAFFYLLCILPELLVISFESTNSFVLSSHIMDCFSFALFYLITILNPLFVLTLHSESRNELLSLFTKRYNSSNIKFELE